MGVKLVAGVYAKSREDAVRKLERGIWHEEKVFDVDDEEVREWEEEESLGDG
jgi:predicted polyphosphate/ATP-dependent NAD kinase